MTTATLGQLQLYTEIARGEGSLAAINVLAGAVTVQATPGVADLYLGSMPDALFFNRTHVIDPAADLAYGDVGTLQIKVTSLGVTLANASAGIQIRAFARGEAPFQNTLEFTGPYPQTLRASTSTMFVTHLIDDLATSLSVRLSGSLGTLLDPLVNGTILPALRPIIVSGLTPVLDPLLTCLADPLLLTLGVGLGEMDVTVFGLCKRRK